MRQGLLFVTTVCLLAADVSAGGKTDPDEEKLKGTWVIVASEQGGSKDDDLKGCKFTFAAGKLETDSHGEKGKGRYNLDSRAKPKILDVTLNVAGPITRLGVYSLTEDTLTIRLALGVDRPAKVQGSTEKDSSWLMTFCTFRWCPPSVAAHRGGKGGSLNRPLLGKRSHSSRD
ncbi:MAG: TIGR03067 domain-containing protein, partial [Gemmataceae bacterium]|nr:TIGR03067 domain-containing protein [Gemmataceae bacterium]